MASETVLIADDSELILMRLEEELGELGLANCVRALDGKQAVRAYRENAIDLTFLDIAMPELDGVKVLQLIRSINPDAYVVMATGTQAIDKIKAALKLGAREVMIKPYSSEKLREVVRNYRSARLAKA